MAEELADSEGTRELHSQLDHTRAALSDKVEALQQRMKDTVDTTKQNVEETMQSIKHAVQDAVHSVKQAFDLKHQTAKHPWAALGIAAAIGVIVARTTKRSASVKAADFSSVRMQPEPSRADWNDGPKMGLKQKLQSQFHDELGKLHALAIGAGVGIFRDWLKKAMPSIASKLEDVIDSATSKMGGEPIAGPILRRSHNGHGDNEAD